MFGFDLDYGDRAFDDEWFHVTLFLTYHTSSAILGHISILDESYRSSWSCVITPTYEMRIETMTCSLFLWWFFSGGSREPFSYARTSRHLDAIMLLHPRDTSWICGYDSVMDSGDQNCIVDDWWFDVIWSFRPVTHSMPYWGIFALSVEICRSPWICMIIPSYEIHVKLMIRFHFVPILWWSLYWVF